MRSRKGRSVPAFKNAPKDVELASPSFPMTPSALRGLLADETLAVSFNVLLSFFDYLFDLCI